jgi:hypothetical protein
MNGEGELSHEHMHGPHGYRPAFVKACEEYGDPGDATADRNVIAIVPGQQVVIGPEILEEDK